MAQRAKKAFFFSLFGGFLHSTGSLKYSYSVFGYPCRVFRSIGCFGWLQVGYICGPNASNWGSWFFRHLVLVFKNFQVCHLCYFFLLSNCQNHVTEKWKLNLWECFTSKLVNNLVFFLDSILNVLKSVLYKYKNTPRSVTAPGGKFCQPTFFIAWSFPCNLVLQKCNKLHICSAFIKTFFVCIDYFKKDNLSSQCQSELVNFSNQIFLELPIQTSKAKLWESHDALSKPSQMKSLSKENFQLCITLNSIVGELYE